jgi:hypothetical protein
MSDPLLDTALVVLTLSKLTMSTALLWLAMRLRRLIARGARTGSQDVRVFAATAAQEPKGGAL